MRDSEGKRRMSSMVKISGLSTRAVEHQPMLLRIDGGNTVVMAFIEESVRRYDAVKILQRRPSDADKYCGRSFGIFLVRCFSNGEGISVRLRAHGGAGRLHPFRNVGRKVVNTFVCADRFRCGKDHSQWRLRPPMQHLHAENRRRDVAATALSMSVGSVKVHPQLRKFRQTTE